VTLHPEHGFYVAQLRVVTPTDLHGVRILPTYYEVREPQDQIAHRTTEVIAWEFVVTRRGATPIVYFVGTTAKWHQIWADPGEITAHTWCGGSSGELSPHGRPDFLFLSSDCYAGKG
jgi:hypothetical protein